MTQAMMGQTWLFPQLTKLYRQRPEMVTDALEKVLETEEDLRWSLVINAYRDGEISLGKAAELLHLPQIVLRDRLIELGIPLHLGSVDVTEAKAEADALDKWLD